mmetsp:Transcript_21774/g.69539  ORF Transcript_21774/g.69539 Transcript_21774/m.69539 type:complete len:225 (+) Transcript_21774:103-777(+)
MSRQSTSDRAMVIASPTESLAASSAPLNTHAAAAPVCGPSNPEWTRRAKPIPESVPLTQSRLQSGGRACVIAASREPRLARRPVSRRAPCGTSTSRARSGMGSATSWRPATTSLPSEAAEMSATAFSGRAHAQVTGPLPRPSTRRRPATLTPRGSCWQSATFSMVESASKVGSAPGTSNTSRQRIHSPLAQSARSEAASLASRMNMPCGRVEEYPATAPKRTDS